MKLYRFHEAFRCCLKLFNVCWAPWDGMTDWASAGEGRSTRCQERVKSYGLEAAHRLREPVLPAMADIGS